MSKTVQIDARREEFRKYLEKEGILESLTKVLITLYEEPEKPSDALAFTRNNFAATELQAMRAQVDTLTKENEQLKAKVSILDQDKAVLQRKIDDMEEASKAKEDKNEEIIAPPKPIDQGEVSDEKPQEVANEKPQEVANEKPQEAMESNEEAPATSPIKEASTDVPVETEPVTDETKSTDEVTAPPAPVIPEANEAKEPNAAEAMETDAPEQEPNAS